MCAVPQGRLAVLDVGTRSPLHHMLLHEGTKPLRTLYEDDFGRSIADVLYFPPGDAAVTGPAAAAAAAAMGGSGKLARGQQEQQQQQQGGGQKRARRNDGRPSKYIVTRRGARTRMSNGSRMIDTSTRDHGVYVSI